MLKSAHVVPRINAEASGVSYCVPRLCDALTEQGTEVELHVLAPVPESPGHAFPTHSYPQWPVAQRLGVSPAMRRALAAAARTRPIMHSHSLWMAPNIYPAAAVRGTGCRLVVSPHGCFSEYMSKRSRLVKAVVWALGQRNVLRNAACLHATSENEYHDLRRNGFEAPVAVIPHGIDIPSEPAPLETGNGRRRLLYLSRIHPQKGIDLLLRAWARIEPRRPDWELEVVGPETGAYSSRMKSLAADLHSSRVRFAGPAYGAAKSRAYRGADLFVLPSHSENFGLVVAEALAHGIPAIATTGAPWASLETEGCGWWIDTGVEALAGCLEEATSRDRRQLLEMGARGRRWMERDYSWQRTAHRMHATYEWVLGGGPAPDWVLTS